LENFFSNFVELKTRKRLNPLVLAEIFEIVVFNIAVVDVVSTVLADKPLER